MNKETIGKKIIAIRKNKGMSQIDLAKKANMLYQTLSKYERGLLNPKLETIKKIADALEVNYLELMEDEEVKKIKEDYSLTLPWYEDWVLVYSGVYQTFKENYDDFYDWYHSTVKEIKHQLHDLKNINFRFNIPFQDYDRDMPDYSKYEFNEHIDYLKNLIIDLDEMFGSLEQMYIDDEQGKFKIDDVIFDTVDKKRKVFFNMHYSSFIDEKTIYEDYYNSLTDDEIEKEFCKLVDKLTLENEKLLTNLRNIKENK